MASDQATFVFEGKEYVLTGREARRQLPSGKDRILIEIRPLRADPDDLTDNKWVERKDLFVIIPRD